MDIIHLRFYIHMTKGTTHSQSLQERLSVTFVVLDNGSYHTALITTIQNARNIINAHLY
jgi:hypothetical protein